MDSTDLTLAPVRRIAIASDHAGFLLKLQLIEELRLLNVEPVDFGCHSPEPCDYPDFIRPAAEAVARGEADRGIVLGGSGNGEAIVANKVRGVRCGLCWNEWSAIMTRAHNDANVISLGARAITVDQAIAIVRIFVETPFEGGRHQQRVAKIE